MRNSSFPTTNKQFTGNSSIWAIGTDMSSSEMMTVIGLGLLGTITRIPFVGDVLYHWDSVNFALALETFDVASGQPHAPGYLLYVLLGRAIHLIAGDAQATFVSISVLSSGLATATLYLLCREMGSRRVGVIAALFLASSPLFWFYGEIALPHSLDAFFVILLVWLLFRIWQGESSLALATGILLGVVGGFRPQTQVFLFPLALFAMRNISRSVWLRAFLGLVLTDILWLVPLLRWNGGFSSYFHTLGQFYFSFNETTSVISGAGLEGISRNILKLGMYTAFGWGGALVAVGFALIDWTGLSPRKLRWFEVGRYHWDFMAFWIVPSLIYYTFIHMGQQGLVFVFLPALLQGSAILLHEQRILNTLQANILMIALVGLNGLVFIVFPTFPLGLDGPKLLTWDTLKRHDFSFNGRFEEVEESFSPDDTAIIAASWRFPEFYLPDYELIPYSLGSRWEVDEGRPLRKESTVISPDSLGLRPTPTGLFHFVIFDRELQSFVEPENRILRVGGRASRELGLLELDTDECLELTASKIRVVEDGIECDQLRGDDL